jgi:hypothetical protein
MGARAADLGRLISTFHFEILGNSGGMVPAMWPQPEGERSPQRPARLSVSTAAPAGTRRARHRPRENRELSQKISILATCWQFICQQHMKPARARRRLWINS